jgi:hypothetical protein
MLLHALSINPLLTRLDAVLTGPMFGTDTQKTVVIAYDDAVTITPTEQTDMLLLQILHTYEQATGAKVNKSKSKALPLGKWNKPIDILGISYIHAAKTLGITYHPKIANSLIIRGRRYSTISNV